MKLRIAIFNGFNSNSSWLISHLLTRGINIVGVAFKGEEPPKQSKRMLLAGYLERIFLWIGHRIVHGDQPFTYTDYIRQYNPNLLQRLRKSNVSYCFVKNHNSPKAEQALNQWQPDILLLYGSSIVKKHILKIPKIGTLNAHSALLPKYRGTKSEFWILLHDEPQHFGVTVHWVTPKLDQGDIFLQEQIPVTAEDTPQMMRQKSGFVAPYLFVEVLRHIELGHLIRTPQNEKIATKFRRPQAEDREMFKRKFPHKKL